MSLRNTAERYGSLAIFLHWFMLALLAAVYACIELRGLFPKGSAERDAIKAWHYMLGLSVFALAAVRLALHLSSATPRIAPSPALWQVALGKTMHVALYAFMLAMPLLGWLVLGADGKPAPFFGVELPALIGPDPALAKELEEWHEEIGNIGYWLIGLHAAAALAHHYFMRDDTLRRMLPKRG
jgi:cytochrome b561